MKVNQYLTDDETEIKHNAMDLFRILCDRNKSPHQHVGACVCACMNMYNVHVMMGNSIQSIWTFQTIDCINSGNKHNRHIRYVFRNC